MLAVYQQACGVATERFSKIGIAEQSYYFLASLTTQRVPVGTQYAYLNHDRPFCRILVEQSLAVKGRERQLPDPLWPTLKNAMPEKCDRLRNSG